MTDELFYTIKIDIENNANITTVEERLKNSLLGLYDEDTVESVIVHNRTPPMDEDMITFLDVLDDLDSDDITQAIEVVERLEDYDDG